METKSSGSEAIKALQNQPPGSYFIATKEQAKDEDTACVIHWIKQNKTVESVEFLKVSDGFTRKGSKRVYKTIDDFLETKQEHFNNQVSIMSEPTKNSQESSESAETEVVDLETQLRELEFYVGYMEGPQCNKALSKYPPGTYLLRKSKKDNFLRLCYVITEERNKKDIKHLQLKEKNDFDEIIDYISNLDGPTIPYSPK